MLSKTPAVKNRANKTINDHVCLSNQPTKLNKTSAIPIIPAPQPPKSLDIMLNNHTKFQNSIYTGNIRDDIIIYLITSKERLIESKMYLKQLIEYSHTCSIFNYRYVKLAVEKWEIYISEEESIIDNNIKFIKDKYAITSDEMRDIMDAKVLESAPINTENIVYPPKYHTARFMNK